MAIRKLLQCLSSKVYTLLITITPLFEGVSDYGLIHPRGAITLLYDVFPLFHRHGLCLHRGWQGSFQSVLRCIFLGWEDNVMGVQGSEVAVSVRSWGRGEGWDPLIVHMGILLETVPENHQIPPVDSLYYSLGSSEWVLMCTAWVPSKGESPHPHQCFPPTHTCYSDNEGQWRALEVKLEMTWGAGYC